MKIETKFNAGEKQVLKLGNQYKKIEILEVNTCTYKSVNGEIKTRVRYIVQNGVNTEEYSEKNILTKDEAIESLKQYLNYKED